MSNDLDAFMQYMQNPGTNAGMVALSDATILLMSDWLSDSKLITGRVEADDECEEFGTEDDAAKVKALCISYQTPHSAGDIVAQPYEWDRDDCEKICIRIMVAGVNWEYIVYWCEGIAYIEEEETGERRELSEVSFINAIKAQIFEAEQAGLAQMRKAKKRKERK